MSRTRFAVFVVACVSCGGRETLPAGNDGGVAGSEAGVSGSDAPVPGSDGSVEGGTVIDSGDEAVTNSLVPDFVWYRLDETSGTTAHDSSANGYDITNLVGVTWSQGASFDSTVGVCGWTNVAADLRQPPVTISAWQTPAPRADSTANDVCYDPFTSNGVSADIAGSSGYGFGINVWTDGVPGSGLTVETGQLGCMQGSFTTVGSFVANQEYSVVLTLADTRATLYVDAAQIASLPAAPPPAASPTLLQLGCVNGSAPVGTKRFFNGHMRDVRVYKRVLTAAEVQQLYASGPSP